MKQKGGYYRIPLITRGWLTWRGGAAEGLICNLSVLGVYVTLDGQLGEGERVQLRFALPDGQRPVECEAEVTWSNAKEPERVEDLPPGNGLRFVSMPPWDHQRIDALIADYRSAVQPLVARPLPHSGFTRVPYVQPCRLHTPTGSTRAVLCNLSTLGVYIAVDPIPPFEERVRLTFRLPRRSAPLEVECEVAWINPDEPMEVESLPTGCGLRFLDLHPDDRNQIQRLVDEYCTLPRESE